ncbi:phage tail protein, partial [Escherichia coli]|nr:phage tail protein [Escherichia coli]
MPVSRYLCIFINVGLGEAAKRDVGTGANQIPDMSSWTKGISTDAIWIRFPDGTI